VYGPPECAGAAQQLAAAGKKSPGSNEPGLEAFLLSHIKAPAQGGKAGGGKPPDA
jgi:hypothetical protein